ncbi:hypothetical protein [Bradyrhizobium sp. USDA 336]|uniref:hypothetical protein n=1 Tax=Bradyrhizobium sp. USDA 336 TaxID=3156311 RepID=UPI00383784E0
MVDPEKLVSQLNAVRAAPAPHVVAFLAMALLVYFAVDWRYSGIVANRDATIASRDAELALARGQRDAYKDKLNGASPDEAKNRIEDLQRQVTALAKHIDPRSIKADQERILAAALKITDGTKPPIGIAADVACTDCSIYGNDIARIFNDAGWGVTVGIIMGNPTPSIVGLNVGVADPGTLSPIEAKVINALKSAGVPFTMSGGAVRRTDLTVGPVLSR